MGTTPKPLVDPRSCTVVVARAARHELGQSEFVGAVMDVTEHHQAFDEISAVAESVPHNRLTFSGGWSRQIGGYAFEKKQTATGLGLSYGYRVHKHIEAEGGLFTALDPTGEICSRLGCVDVNDRFFWLPFGFRFIAPPYLGRVEFSGGGGGLYEKYTVGSPFPGAGPASRHGWGGYIVASTAVTLDHSRRFWLGTTPRLFLANPAFARDRWLQISGEFSVRFR